VKWITVHLTWQNSQTVEVPDDFEDDGTLGEWADEVDTLGAYLSDWEFTA
jgi:hypothetical protein